MKVGVTGGAGFIGGHVCDVLRERGHEPLIFDHLARRGGSDVEVMLGDVRDPVAMNELAAHVDGVIHLAACLGTQETIANPRPAAETNVVGGLNFLEAITSYGIAGCYIGVGNHWMENSYSITKTTIERFVTMYNRERGTRCNTVRLVNAYGPRQSVAPPFAAAKVRKVTPSFVCRALTGLPVEVYGDGEQISDMVWVRDGARALVLALEAAAAGTVVPSAMECGPDRHTMVGKLAALVVDEVERQTGVRSKITHLPMRPGETPGAVVTCDPSTLAPIGMGAADLKPLNEGIAETVAWFIENEGIAWSRP
jgi:UDP-glucose 4-epimerase